MKNLLLVFTALLVISGIVSASLWRDLRTERQANGQLRSQLAKAVSISRASATPAAPAQPVATPPPAALSEAPIVGAKPALPALESEVFMRATTAAITAGATALTGGIVGESELMNDPEYRKAQLTQARLRIAQSNPGLAEALGISRTEADHLFEVMAEAQLKLTDEFTEMVTKAAGATPSIAAMMEKASGRQDPARTVLGEARYAQYQEYLRDAKPALTRVSNMGYILKYASQPLNDSQSRAVAAAVLAEQQRQQQEAALAPRPNPNPGIPRNAADTLAEYRKTEDESSRRILAAVSPHLNSAQIDVLQKEIEQQAAFARRTDTRLQTLPQPASPATRAP